MRIILAIIPIKTTNKDDLTIILSKRSSSPVIQKNSTRTADNNNVSLSFIYIPV